MNKATSLLCILLTIRAFSAQTFVAASTQYYVATSPLNETGDWTYFARIYPRSAPANMVALWIGVTNIATDYLRLISSSGTINAQYTRSGVIVSGGTMALSLNTWYNVACTATLTGTNMAFSLYVDGASKGTGNSATNANIFQYLAVGARWNAAWGLPWDGDIQDVAVWDVGLTADEILSLSYGCSPLIIRPADLVFYAPLGERATDVSGGRLLTKTGTPGVSANSPRTWGRK